MSSPTDNRSNPKLWCDVIVVISLTPIALLIALSSKKIFTSNCMQIERLSCGCHSNSSHICCLANPFDSNTFICPKEALGAWTCLLHGNVSLLLVIVTSLHYRQMNYACDIWTLNWQGGSMCCSSSVYLPVLSSICTNTRHSLYISIWINLNPSMDKLLRPWCSVRGNIYQFANFNGAAI